jgi:hypothetical protein
MSSLGMLIAFALAMLLPIILASSLDLPSLYLLASSTTFALDLLLQVLLAITPVLLARTLDMIFANN